MFRFHQRPPKTEAGTRLSEYNDNDIILGKGERRNIGNLRYRKLVESELKQYVHSDKLNKSEVARRILQTIQTQDPPGRFLKKEGPVYIVVSDEDAVVSIMQRFRDNKKKESKGTDATTKKKGGASGAKKKTPKGGFSMRMGSLFQLKVDEAKPPALPPPSQPIYDSVHQQTTTATTVPSFDSLAYPPDGVTNEPFYIQHEQRHNVVSNEDFETSNLGESTAAAALSFGREMEPQHVVVPGENDSAAMLFHEDMSLMSGSLQTMRIDEDGAFGSIASVASSKVTAFSAFGDNNSQAMSAMSTSNMSTNMA